MADAVFRPNQAGFRAIANSPELRRALLEVAERGKTHAESLSQDFRREANPEDVYADRFEVREETIAWEGRFPGPRAAARLQNTSAHAAAVEYGYSGSSSEPNTRNAHRVLGRTLEFLAGEQ